MSEQELNKNAAEALVNLAKALVDQSAAKMLVAPKENADGFWFGSGNLIEPEPGRFLLCGRYRNHGDSRTGTGAGARGLEFAIFEGSSPTGPFTKVRMFSKQDLSRPEAPVVSIEGGKLFFSPAGLEMIVSTEKGVDYPDALASFQKPGTGVWAIDRIAAADVSALDASTLSSAKSSTKLGSVTSSEPPGTKQPWLAGNP